MRMVLAQELLYPDFRVRRPGFLKPEHAKTWDVSEPAGGLGSTSAVNQTCCTPSVTAVPPCGVCEHTCALDASQEADSDRC